MSVSKKYSVNNLKDRDSKLRSVLKWADSCFPAVCVLNSNSGFSDIDSQKKGRDFDVLLAVGGKQELSPARDRNFDRIKGFYQENKTRLLGFFSYDLKNDLEDLSSSNFDGIEMPLMHFFKPEIVFEFKGNKLTIICPDKKFDPEEIFGNPEFRKTKPERGTESRKPGIRLKPRVSKKKYIGQVKKIKKHIQRGDIYEINFCQEFYAEKTELDPVETYFRLNENSPMPFSCFYKLKNKYLLCASPERFLKKTGHKIISQPIKGTIRRGRNKKEDVQLKNQLFDNKKEQSENVMIVDLVRNDLSRFAKPGTVKVEELCGIYSYRNLHQMISTISCRPEKGIHVMDAIKNTFPMGSMTGAPKVKAMELIEKYESTRRGLFSGAVGYFSGTGNFDFNVVIRSILYNAEKKYISVMAGSAITAESDAEKEYEECLLKAKPMFMALGRKD